MISPGIENEDFEYFSNSDDDDDINDDGDEEWQWWRWPRKVDPLRHVVATIARTGEPNRLLRFSEGEKYQ